MASPVVIVVPGIMGSELQGKVGGLFWIKLWLSIPTLATDLKSLALAADGINPRSDASVSAVRPAGILAEYYGGMVRYLQLIGYNAIPFGYDWRQSVQESGRQLAGLILSQYPGRDVIFVAHSLGGMVARAAWKYLDQAGADHVVRLVTLGTPHRGTLSIPQLFGHLDPTWNLLVQLVGGPFMRRALAGTIVDSVVASFVTPYEMLPFRGRFPSEVDFALRNAATYVGYNAAIQPGRLAAADTVQGWLTDAGDPARTVSVVGTGIPTPRGIVNTNALNSPAGYDWNGDGDGRVETASAAWPGTVTWPVAGVAHHAMPYSPTILLALQSLLSVQFSRSQA